MSRRLKIAAVAIVGLLWLCTVHVSVPLAGQVPAAAFAALPEAAVLAVIATGITRSIRGWSVRTG